MSLTPKLQLDRGVGSCSACTSVFAAMNSTPSSLAAIMRLTALPPPPPTPMTLIFAPRATSSWY